MKLHRIFAFLLTTMLVMLYSLPITVVYAGTLPEMSKGHSAVSEDKSDPSDNNHDCQSTDWYKRRQNSKEKTLNMLCYTTQESGS